MLINSKTTNFAFEKPGTGCKLSGFAKPFKTTNVMKKFNEIEAKEIGNKLKIDWKEISLDQFTKGLNVELEHGSKDSQTNVTDNDGKLTGEIALAHLKEFPDYYTRLAKMEKGAKADLKKD